MYKDAVISYEIAVDMAAKGVKSKTSLFLWCKGPEKDSFLVIRREDYGDTDSDSIPAYTADELSLCISRLCFLQSTYMRLSLSHGTPKVSDMLAETITSALDDKSLPIEQVNMCIEKESSVPVATTKADFQYTPKAHISMFTVLQDWIQGEGFNEKDCSVKLLDYKLLFKTAADGRIVLVIVEGADKKAVIIKEVDRSVTFQEGSDYELSLVAREAAKKLGLS